MVNSPAITTHGMTPFAAAVIRVRCVLRRRPHSPHSHSRSKLNTPPQHSTTFTGAARPSPFTSKSPNVQGSAPFASHRQPSPASICKVLLPEGPMRTHIPPYRHACMRKHPRDVNRDPTERGSGIAESALLHTYGGQGLAITTGGFSAGFSLFSRRGANWRTWECGGI